MKREEVIIFSFCAIIIFICGCILSFFAVMFPLKYKENIIKYSSEFNLPPEMTASIIRAESRFNENAISRVGARGLMQLLPSTANEVAQKLNISNFSTNDLFIPTINIRLGCCYFRQLLDSFENIDTAICAYNAGPNKVASWLKNPEYSLDQKTLTTIPYPETFNYLKKIKSSINIYYNFF